MNMSDFKSLMLEQSEIDRTRKSLEIEGESINKILDEAAKMLSTSIHNLDYEVLVKGSNKLFRFFTQRKYRLLVYHSEILRDDDGSISINKDMLAVNENSLPVDATYYIQIRNDGVYLKVVPPINGGLDLALDDINFSFKALDVSNINQSLLELSVRTYNTKDYIKIGDYPDYNSKNDCKYDVVISDDAMAVNLYMSKGGDNGADPNFYLALQALEANGVNSGIIEDDLLSFCDNKKLNEYLLVAKGKEAINGADTRLEIFEYKEKSRDLNPDGKIDFKNVGRIHVVKAGEKIAKVHPASQGELGYDVLGNEREALAGNELEISVGHNIEYNKETGDIISTTDGILSVNNITGIISVDEIFMVEGDLVSNIDFPGSIIINGDVGNDFIIHATGDVRVKGNMGRTKIKTDGNIILEKGINGVSSRDTLMLDSGGNIWASYINNTSVRAKNYLVVSDGILNSSVVCFNKIICIGRHATIVSSYALARNYIYAVSLGSSSGVTTEVLVGIDLSLDEKMQRERDTVKEKLEGLTYLKNDVKAKQRFINMRGDKADKKLKMELKALTEKLEETEAMISQSRIKIQEQEEQRTIIAANASIAVDGSINNGVEIGIGLERLNINADYQRKATLKLSESGNIELFPFEEFDESEIGNIR